MNHNISRHSVTTFNFCRNGSFARWYNKYIDCWICQCATENWIKCYCKISQRKAFPVVTVYEAELFADSHNTRVGSLGSMQTPRKQPDLLASGNPYAVLTQPELANVITSLFVVNSSLIEMYKWRCSMNVGSLLVSQSPRWPAEDSLACAPSTPAPLL